MLMFKVVISTLVALHYIYYGCCCDITFRVFLAKQFESLQPYCESCIPETRRGFLQQYFLQVRILPSSSSMTLYHQTVHNVDELRKPVYSQVSKQAINYAQVRLRRAHVQCIAVFFVINSSKIFGEKTCADNSLHYDSLNCIHMYTNCMCIKQFSQGSTLKWHAPLKLPPIRTILQISYAKKSTLTEQF